MGNYTALLVDVKQSKKYSDEDRLKLQIYMQSCINALNEFFVKDLELEVVINAGDSMQGLFKNTTAAVMYFRLLELMMYPVRIRGGIGVGAWNIQIGKWDVELEYVSSAQQDGQTFHRARTAIQEVYKKQQHNLRICTGGEDTFTNYLLNASLIMKSEQMEKQNQVLMILELLYPFVRTGQVQDCEKWLQSLLKLKMKFRLSERKGKISEETVPVNLCSREISVPCEVILIDGEMKEPEQSVMKKNMAEHVASILGCTRQNAASIIKNGNAMKIREMDYMALQYLELHEKEEGKERK